MWGLFSYAHLNSELILFQVRNTLLPQSCLVPGMISLQTGQNLDVSFQRPMDGTLVRNFQKLLPLRVGQITFGFNRAFNNVDFLLPFGGTGFAVICVHFLMR